MKRLVTGVAIAVALSAGLGWLLLRDDDPPEVNFVKARRDRLVSRLVTNGRIEPVNDIAMAAPRDGRIARVRVTAGQRVAAGSVIADMDTSQFAAELSGAHARLAEAQADLRVIEAGGRKAEQAELDAAIATTSQQIVETRGRLAATKRLVEKQAAPRAELEQLEARIAALEAEGSGLMQRRAALVESGGLEAAEARRNAAEAAIADLRRQAEAGLVRTPVSGVVYELAVRQAGPVRAGEVIARIGQVSQVRTIVYVDEPELGRVSVGMKVRITWDAMPKREWTGEVSRMPSRIVALSARQVGEVECLVDNGDEALLPGANINAELITGVVEGAVLVPTGAVRRNGPQTGVLVLNGDRVEWRAVTAGASSVTDTQIISGVSDGESVALGAYESLAAGDRVTPRHP